jgi:hypothetical protein
MRKKNPERMAWLVLWGAFVAFLLLCTAVPVGARSYLLFSTSQKQALFEWISGTPSIQERGSAAPIAVTNINKSVEIQQESVIETDANSRGIVTFFDGSTLQIFPNTQVTLAEMIAPSFDWGLVPMRIVVKVGRGHVRATPAPLYPEGNESPHDRVFEVQTPHMVASLNDGSFAVDVNTVDTDSSQIVAADGVAQVTAQGQTVSIARRQRTVVTRGNPPLRAMPAAQDLIVNGDFRDPPPRGWLAFQDQTPPLGTADIVTLGDLLAGHLVRSESGTGASARTGMTQAINREVSDFHSLRLYADVRLHNQSLAGGGVLSSEYPLILRLRYRDVDGSEVEWVHGFYYQNSGNPPNPTNNGEQIPIDTWYAFESGNLFETQEFKPFYITTLELYASGWDYESYVTNVRLVVE